MCKWMIRVGCFWICFECRRFGRDGFQPKSPRELVILPFLRRETWIWGC
jgi:hypothetical protein